MHDDAIYWTWMRCAMTDWVNWLNWLMDFIEWMNAPLTGGDMKLWCCWSNVVLQASWIFELLYIIILILTLWLWFFTVVASVWLEAHFWYLLCLFLPFFLLCLFEYYLFYLNWIFFLSAFLEWTRTMMMVMLRWTRFQIGCWLMIKCVMLRVCFYDYYYRFYDYVARAR